jgi:hypothetical protein
MAQVDGEEAFQDEAVEAEEEAINESEVDFASDSKSDLLEDDSDTDDQTDEQIEAQSRQLMYELNVESHSNSQLEADSFSENGSEHSEDNIIDDYTDEQVEEASRQVMYMLETVRDMSNVTSEELEDYEAERLREFCLDHSIPERKISPLIDHEKEIYEDYVVDKEIPEDEEILDDTDAHIQISTVTDVPTDKDFDEEEPHFKKEKLPAAVSIFEQANATAYTDPANIFAFLERPTYDDTDSEAEFDETSGDDHGAQSEATEDFFAPNESTDEDTAGDVEEETVAATELAEDNEYADTSVEDEITTVIVEQDTGSIEEDVIATTESAEEEEDMPPFVLLEATATRSTLMSVITLYETQFDDDESSEYVNGYEYVPQRERHAQPEFTVPVIEVFNSPPELKYEDDANYDQVGAYEYLLNRDREVLDTEDELTSSEDEGSSDDAASAGSAITSPLLSSEKATASPLMMKLQRSMSLRSMDTPLILQKTRKRLLSLRRSTIQTMMEQSHSSKRRFRSSGFLSLPPRSGRF